MLQPRSKVFKLKFHLAKVEASTNKVNSKVHVYVMIENQQLQFNSAPQLKKNIAIFGQDLIYQNFMIGYDQATGLYEQKRALIVIEFQTMGAYIKVGEVSVNLGQILNQKKYRVVDVYPLNKCYDKTAKIKLAVDFVPQTRGSVQQANNNSRKIVAISTVKHNTIQNTLQVTNNQANKASSVMGSSGYYKNPTGIIKSRLAEEENAILQQRIYEYEKRMDKYRSAQNQLSEKMQEQIERKDQKINQLTIEVSKLQNSMHTSTMQNESLKNEIKSLAQDVDYRQRQSKQLRLKLDELNKKYLSLQKQLQAKNTSIENINRAKQHKQRHLNAQITKYTLKYSQSEQQRNKIIFQLESKLKLQLQKKDKHYQQLLSGNQQQFTVTIKTLKERNKYLEGEFKLVHQLSEDQESKIKALNLQLSKSVQLCSQKEEEMVYMNQETNKLKKTNDSLMHEIDSLNFSYQQAVTELASLKEINKQLNKKLENTKTELALSNQTVTELNQRITLMNKELQVHSERQFYMKEHFQQQIYGMECTENSIKTQNEQLHFQLTKYKEQLKLTQQKLQEEQNLNQTLKNTLQTYQKQITHKNSLLIKLNQEKLSQENQLKTQLKNMQQLELKITQLEKQKIQLAESIYQNNFNTENQKSLQWAIKIQSLQNDIQILVEKFKNQKNTLIQQHKKEDHKKSQHITNLVTQNHKLKEEISSLKQKLTKKQNNLITVQKSLKNEKEKSFELQRQVSSIKQTLRAESSEKESYEQKLRELSRVRDSLLSSVSELESKSQRQKKQILSTKSSYQRLISMVLDYMVKRYSEKISFQQMSVQGVDNEMLGYVNVALKKYCDEHNKARNIVKSLQEWRKDVESEGGNFKTNRFQNGVEQDSNMEIDFFANNPEKYNANKSSFMNRFSQHEENNQVTFRKQYSRNSLSPSNRAFSPGIRTSLISQQNELQTIQSLRKQIDRYKKQQSQFRVKIKSLQQEIQKHQRNTENAKFQTNKLKNELQQSQDQMNKITFAMRKKDKIIKQLENELQDIQKENLELKATPHFVIEKAKEKLANSIISPAQQSPSSIMLIKDFQLRLSLKEQECSFLQKQIQNLRNQYLTQLNNIKKLQSKLKEKNQQIVSLQNNIQQSKLKQFQSIQKQNNKLRKEISKIMQEKMILEGKNQQLEMTVKEYQIQASNLQQRNKDLHEQLKATESQFRRNLQSSEYQMNDKQTFYQTEIMQLKSQASQLEDKVKELTHKNSHLNQTLGKKNVEIEALKERLNSIQKQMFKNEQIKGEEENKMTIKVNSLNDRIRQLQNQIEMKQFEIEECKFAYEGRVLQLQRQIDDFLNTPVKLSGNLSP